MAFGLAWAGVDAYAQGACSAARLANIVSIEGSVEVRHEGDAGNWRSAIRDEALCPGDAVRVGANSRAALRLTNETTLRLDQRSSVSFGATPASIDQSGGAVHVITRTPKALRIRTPFVNASVEGTEFLVRVEPDSARVSVFEGAVVAANDDGSVRLTHGEEASAVRAAAPERRLVLRPRDAVAWAVHVPSVVDPRRLAAATPALRNALQAYGQGGAPAALQALGAESDAGSATRIAEAVWLLQAGRLDDAEARLATARDANADVRALQSIVALARGRTDDALNASADALALEPSSAAWIARSYALQSRFRIEDALAAARSAADADPDSALAWARVAELELSSGRQAAAASAARTAVSLDAVLARTQTVLGFTSLQQRYLPAARAAFEQAIALDQGDPLPRLGLGLALMRGGALAEGREQLEIGASLDPTDAGLRSYLGKAYFDEHRDPLARRQYELAQMLDPLDPTPWLYAAVLAHAENRDIDALDAALRSIALNDGRAVYRSRLLLDQDRATRQALAATVIAELGSPREAAALAGASLADDPANAAAHRFMSESYARRERSDIGRVSELLQTQMLAPVGSWRVPSPALPFTDLGLESTGLGDGGYGDETGTSSERDGVSAFGSLLGGNRGTTGYEAAVGGLRGRVAGGIGLFRYQTDGFRPNSDIGHRIENAFLHASLLPELAVQAEWRHRTTDQGDIASTFDPDAYEPKDRLGIEQRVVRFGLAWKPEPGRSVLLSYAHSREVYDYVYDFAGAFALAQRFDSEAQLFELQVQQVWREVTLVFGAGRTRGSGVIDEQYDYSAAAAASCPAESAPCDFASASDAKQWNAYLYLHWRPAAEFTSTVGVSRDDVEDLNLRARRWNPKLGLRWAASPATTVRAAYLGTLKRQLVAQQTLEPTQVAGFGQWYDDVLGTDSRITTAAVDWRRDSAFGAGIELGRQRQRLGGGSAGGEFEAPPVQHLSNRWARADATWTLSSRWLVSAALSDERFRWVLTVPADWPTDMHTVKLPLTLRAYPWPRWSFEATATRVWQSVERLPGSLAAVGSERFSVVDLGVVYRWPGRAATVSLQAKNVFGTRFAYQDDTFRSNETRLSPFLPIRRLVIKASFAF